MPRQAGRRAVIAAGPICRYRAHGITFESCSSGKLSCRQYTSTQRTNGAPSEARYSDEFVGFGGARDFDGRQSFAPRLPHARNELAFSLRFGGRQIRARLTRDAECCLVHNGAPLNVLVRGEPHLLGPGNAVAIKLPPP